MDLTNFTIGKSHREGPVFLGKLSKDRKRWLSRKEITDEFLELIIAYVGEDRTIDIEDGSGKKLYEITVKKINV